jgi:hypothetical protein
MARNVSGRLQKLATRRKGLDRLSKLTLDERIDVASRGTVAEAWEKRATTQPYTRYALGGMQEVGPDYTQKSIETAIRVGKQLEAGLRLAGFSIEFRLQGSVPLNVHIRGVSDVDLLNLDTSFFTYAVAGPRAQAGLYTSPTPRTSIGVLSELRAEAEKILKSQYPAAEVDTTGGKAISISGGSLARPVDVVPSHWFDTVNYQQTHDETHRGITIFDSKKQQTIDNFPFLHIALINYADQATSGGLKKAIRLCKNVKSDAESEGTAIGLPSFDIAATMYHADKSKLSLGSVHELAILAETQRHLDYLARNPEAARSLKVPDGSRAIFDTVEKFNGLKALSIEIDDLAVEVAKEQSFKIRYELSPTFFDSRAALDAAKVN